MRLEAQRQRTPSRLASPVPPAFPRIPRRRTVALIAVGGAAIALTGCGSVGYLNASEGDKARGKELFVAKCGSCHVLADAGTTGVIGPNLDAAFVQSRRDGLGESTFVQVVRGQIAYPVVKTSTGAPGMPADIVTGQDADDIAAYVGAVAGTEPLSAPPSPAPAPAPAPSPATPKPPGVPDQAAGKAVFASAGCGSCHTLADANATGTIGPDLDDAKPDEALVKARVTNGQGGMPSFSEQLSEEQIAAVAAYVSTVAG
jgi:mono/diheme cytochrome c family protein